MNTKVVHTVVFFAYLKTLWTTFCLERINLKSLYRGGGGVVFCDAEKPNCQLKAKYARVHEIMWQAAASRGSLGCGYFVKWWHMQLNRRQIKEILYTRKQMAGPGNLKCWIDKSVMQYHVATASIWQYIIMNKKQKNNMSEKFAEAKTTFQTLPQ